VAKYRAYQIAFDEHSKANVNKDFAWTYFQKETTPYFENAVMLKLVNAGAHKQADYFAVLSHKFFDDTLNSELKPITQKEIEDSLGDTDVVSFFGFKRNNFEIFQHAEKVHKGIADCYRELFRLLGKTYNPLEQMRFVVYRNAFFARSEVYERYVKEMLEPCIELMNDKKNHLLYQAIWKDSRYPYQESRFQKHEGLREKFVHDMGVPYYPFHTFILERMFSYWLNLNPEITCKHI
jgi:hypothetical protein